jgi:hypothetical protein
LLTVSFKGKTAAALGAALALGMLLAATALAHVHLEAGSYKIALGWAEEPTYSGELNAVQILVSDANDQPVTDLGPDDLHVTVSAAGQTSDQLAFEPAFDEDEGTGTPGDYRAAIIPTIPGDYTFHLTGSIHGQTVDSTATSSDSTFATVVDPTAIQFPNQLPSAADLATRIDRLDARSSSADTTALIVGGVLGTAGIVIGVIALLVASRARRPAAAA